MPAIEKDVRPEVSRMKDHVVIQQSEAQINPYLARPEDFTVLQPGEAELPSHGQCGDTKQQYRRLLDNSAADRGKSKPVKSLD